MRLVIIGAEYAGCSTLVEGVAGWAAETLGPPIPKGAPAFHDHFTLPAVGHEELSEEEYADFMKVSPSIKEMFQRFMTKYHINSTLYRYPDHLVVGFHIEEAVYAPMYYGYGGGARSNWARSVEREMIEKAPETVLVLVDASTETIAERMRRSPHPYGVLQTKDIDAARRRFREQYDATLFMFKFELDTTDSTPAQTLRQFIDDYQPHLTDSDRSRILVRRALNPGP